MKRQVLLIEDDDDLRLSLSQTIELAGMTPLAMSGYLQARRHIRANFAGVILTDVRMPQQNGFDVLRAAQAADPELPVIMLTGHSDVPSATRAMKEGGWDYLEKPCGTDRLIEVLERAMAHREVVLRSRRAERMLAKNDPANRVFPGSGQVTESLRQALRLAAASRQHVYISGTEGSGRRQAAELINQLAVDGVPLFDGSRERLDEQLVVLNREHPDGADVVIATEGLAPSSLTELRRAVADRNCQHRFIIIGVELESDRHTNAIPGWVSRDGLAHVSVPSLAERREDIAEIFQIALHQIAQAMAIDVPPLSEDLMVELMQRPWHGNLPELQEYARTMVIRQEHTGAVDRTLAGQVAAFERQVIIDALRRANGKAAVAARELGLPRNTFYDRMSRYDINARDYRRPSPA